MRSFTGAFIAADEPGGAGEAAAGDHLQTVYRFWLVGHQLGRGALPWRDPYSFQPLVESQVNLSGWSFGLPFWPLEVAFGPVVAWNVLLLATIVAAGLLTYAWLRSLGLGRPPAAVGGLAFAIAPYRLEQSAGHLLGWIAVLLPLALLAIERSRAAGTRRAAHGWAALAAASLVSIALAGQLHLALGAIPFALAYALVRYRPIPAAWCAGGALVTVGIGIAIRYTLIAGSPEGEGRSLAEVGEFSAEWVDLLSRRQLGQSEEFAYLGWLTPLLALAGFVFLLRRRRALALLLGVAALVPVLLALGTNLPLYSALWHAFPPLRFPRAPARLLPIADLALAALAAVAAAHLVARAGKRAGAAAAALLALVVLDLGVRPLGAAAADPENEAYAALDASPPARVLELPLFEPGVHYGSAYDYYVMQAPRERLGGYSTLAPERAYAFYFRYNRLSCGVWLPGDLARLSSFGVGRVLFHRGLYEQGDVPGAWFGWRRLALAGYRPLAHDGPVTLFAPGSGLEAAPVSGPPVPEPPRDRPLFCEGWRGRTMEERDAPFWLYGEGTLALELSAPGTTRARLWVDGEVVQRFTVSRRQSISTALEGSGWHALVLDLPRLFETKPPQGLRLRQLRLQPAS